MLAKLNLILGNEDTKIIYRMTISSQYDPYYSSGGNGYSYMGNDKIEPILEFHLNQMSQKSETPNFHLIETAISRFCKETNGAFTGRHYSHDNIAHTVTYTLVMFTMDQLELGLDKLAKEATDRIFTKELEETLTT